MLGWVAQREGHFAARPAAPQAGCYVPLLREALKMFLLFCLLQSVFRPLLICKSKAAAAATTTMGGWGGGRTQREAAVAAEAVRARADRRHVHSQGVDKISRKSINRPFVFG